MTQPLQGTLENRDGAWVLTLIRDFGQPAEKLWPWLTDPDRLGQWSPIVPDRALDSVGPREVRENPDHEPVTGNVVGVDQPLGEPDRGVLGQPLSLWWIGCPSRTPRDQMA